MDSDFFQNAGKERGLVSILRRISDSIEYDEITQETLRSPAILAGWTRTESLSAPSDQASSRLPVATKETTQCKRHSDVIRSQTVHKVHSTGRRKFATKDGLVSTISKRKIMPTIIRRPTQPYPTRRVETRKSQACSEPDLYKRKKHNDDSEGLTLGSLLQEEGSTLRPLANNTNLSSANFIDMRSVMRSSVASQSGNKRELLKAMLRKNRPEESESSPCLIRGSELKQLVAPQVSVKTMTENADDLKKTPRNKTASSFVRKQNNGKPSYRALSCVRCDNEARAEKLILLPSIDKKRKRKRSGFVEWAPIKQDRPPVQLPVVSTPPIAERPISQGSPNIRCQHRFWKSSNYDCKFPTALPFILQRDEKTQYRFNAFDPRTQKKPCTEVAAITQSNVKVGIKHSSIKKLVRQDVQSDINLPYVSGSKLNASILCNQLESLPTNFSA